MGITTTTSFHDIHLTSFTHPHYKRSLSTLSHTFPIPLPRTGTKTTTQIPKPGHAPTISRPPNPAIDSSYHALCMRLIDTATFSLHEFFGDDIPRYAILSHRWEGGEVTYQDFVSGNGSAMMGWAKIEGACRKAESDGWGFVWIDCCCIDKTSSVELSEAINSMFNWYRDSEVCYAYLSDVPPGGDQDFFLQNSKWFTRGWTLQELLAPQWVIFLDKEWNEMGTKETLQSRLEDITGITHLSEYQNACIAQKMSWASRRETTRQEDQAYCLMGIFDVSMPLLYGEGSNAFVRLQLEILSKSDDESIFAWTDEASTDGLGLLATSPALFANSSLVRRANFDAERPPYMMTNKGLRLELLLTPNLSQSNFIRSELLAPLNCSIALFGKSERHFERDGKQLENLVALPLVSENGKVYRSGGLETLEFDEQNGPSFQLSPRTILHIDQKVARPPVLDQMILQILFHTRGLYESSYRLCESYNWFGSSGSEYEWFDHSDISTPFPFQFVGGAGGTTLTFNTGPQRDYELSVRFFAEPAFLVGLLFRVITADTTEIEKDQCAVFIGSNPHEIYIEVICGVPGTLNEIARETQFKATDAFGERTGPPRPSVRKDKFLFRPNEGTSLMACLKKVGVEKGLVVYVTELTFGKNLPLLRS